MENPYDRGRPSPYLKCMRRLFNGNGNGKPRSCRNRRCPSAKCRAGYAEKEAAILERSFRTKPPDFTFVLEFDDGESTGDRRMAAYLNAFNQKIKDRRKSEGITLEYDNRIEFGRDSNPHCHLTVITSAPWSEGQAHSRIRALWIASCPDRKVSVYGDFVHNGIGLANYVCKNLKDRSGVRGPPPGWNGKTCRFVRTSKGFLSGSKKSLWKEHCEDWYPTVRAPRGEDDTPTPPGPREKVSGHAANWKRVLSRPAETRIRPKKTATGRNSSFPARIHRALSERSVFLRESERLLHRCLPGHVGVQRRIVRRFRPGFLRFPGFEYSLRLTSRPAAIAEIETRGGGGRRGRGDSGRAEYTTPIRRAREPPGLGHV